MALMGQERVHRFSSRVPGSLMPELPRSAATPSDNLSRPVLGHARSWMLKSARNISVSRSDPGSECPHACPDVPAVRAFPVSVKGVAVRDGQVLLLENERAEWELPSG